MYGKQNVEHQFKILGTYYFDNAFEAGAIYNWNSGTQELIIVKLSLLVDVTYLYKLRLHTNSVDTLLSG
jgi:hypothetical protein